MDRTAFEARLNQLLDERRPVESDDELRLAAEHDEELSQLYVAYKALLAGAGRLQSPDAPPDLASQVIAELTHRRRRRPAVRWVIGLATAASLLCGLSWLMSGGGREPTTMEAGIAAQPDPRPPSENAVAGPPLDRLTRDAADRYQALADATSEHVAQALLVVPRLGDRGPTAATAGQAESENLTEIQASASGGRLSGGLMSLGRSTGGSMASLLRAIPIAEGSSG